MIFFKVDYHDLILKQEQNSDTGILQQEVIESELNVKSGPEKWVRMTVISIIWEGLPSAIFLLEDITDYKTCLPVSAENRETVQIPF